MREFRGRLLWSAAPPPGVIAVDRQYGEGDRDRYPENGVVRSGRVLGGKGIGMISCAGHYELLYRMLTSRRDASI